jgi:serpin B
MAIMILASYALLIYFQAYNQNLAYAASDEKAYSVDEALVSANTKFAFNLFKELVAEDKNKNIFISPLSISTALAVTYNGAEGTTKDAMAKTLEFGNMSLEKVNQEYLNLIESLENADEQVKLMIGNSIWMRKEFESYVNSSFMDRVVTFFSSEAFTRDFGDPQTVNEINGWVDEKTDGKINEIIQEIDPEIVMFLINAIYFKGNWVTEFDESKTQKQDFFLSEGNTVQVDMMSTSGNFSYYRGENFQAVRLPYGRDKIAMYIFLPDEGVPLDSFIANLDQATHEEYLSGFEPIDFAVKLPKFKVEYGVKRLNDVLKKLGMEIAFDPFGANFKGIASTPEGNLFIDYVDHKAIVEVNEKGTEAAAATIVGIGLTSISPGLVVNRPFFFEIRDDRSGSILFMGKIVNPAQE